MRTRRLRTVSSVIRPKRTQCSIRFSSQVSSTYAMAAALKLLIGGPGGLYVAGFAIGCTWLEVFSQ
jgi:hypothetical protein